jgi:hypothetical protein
MEQLLVASPRVVLTVEFWPMGSRLGGDDASSVLAYYRSLGLEIRVQHSDEVGVLEWTTRRSCADATRKRVRPLRTWFSRAGSGPQKAVIG